MVGGKAFKSKILIYVCVIIIVIMSIPLDAMAATGLTSSSRSNLYNNIYVTCTEGTAVSDDLYYISGNVSGEFTVPIYPTGGDFFKGGYNINYTYSVTYYNFNQWLTNSINSNVLYLCSYPNITFTLVSNDVEIPLNNDGTGWMQVPMTLPNKLYLTLKVKYSYDYLINYKNATLGSACEVALRPYILFDFVEWNEYNMTDYYANLLADVESIASNVSGVQGAVESQTTVIQQESQKEQILQQEGNQLQEEGNALQEEANTLQEEANTTSKNIFEKITDFFDNFFTRLGDFLLGLIVPSSDDLTAFLNEVNDWFSERLGFIWYPFSFAVDAVSALAGGTADTGITVPALTLNMFGGTYTIWNEMQVDLDAFGIFRYVRLFTSFICVGGIVALAYNKWDEWIGGHGVG